MNDEMQDNRIHFLYRVTNKINGKIYIGQTVDTTSRWRGHRRDAAEPKVPFHHAIKKHGAHNFNFEVIATCKGFANANELETLLVTQYDSYVSNGRGYNASHGGMNAPKSPEWIQKMKEYHANLPPEERAEISEKQRQATIKQIVEKGHPAQGTRRTPEQSVRLSQARKDHPVEYTPEIRQKMSEVHIGKVIPEEQRQKMANSIKEQWKIRGDYASKKCEAPGCEVSGKAKYKIINGARYCNKHGLRMLRYNRLNILDS